MFVTVDTEEDDHRRIIEFLGLKGEKFPTMRIIQMKDDIDKYKAVEGQHDQHDITNEDNLRKFVQDYLDGKVPQHYLTEDLPEDWNKHPVKYLTGKNFDEVVFDKSKNPEEILHYIDQLREKIDQKFQKLSVAPGEKGKWINWGSDLYLEEKLFPALFPFGWGGYLSSNMLKNSNIGFSNYVKSRLFSINPKPFLSNLITKTIKAYTFLAERLSIEMLLQPYLGQKTITFRKNILD